MGNRAEVRFLNNEEHHVIYLHWNGGPESVLAFLEVMRERGWTRMDYASAHFCGVVSEFFDSDGDSSGNSLGIFDEYCGAGDDNGLYEVESIEPLLVKQNGKIAKVPKDDTDNYLGIIRLLRDLRELREKHARESV